MKGAGELKILQGTHVFFSQMNGERENTVGDLLFKSSHCLMKEL